MTVELPAPVRQRLRARYDEPHRRYHTWAHVQACLLARDCLVSRSSAAIDLALLFHDAVYEPLARDNEERSAALLREECGGFDPSVLDDACAAILATKHRATGPSSETIRVVCDADLAILGAAPSEFSAYERAVREEYAVVDDATYRVGRARILRGFLAQPHLYETLRGQQLWEARARLNLHESLQRLAA